MGSPRAQHADLYQLTGETGSYRYMAPEVFRHQPYNAKVDVYGFSMICYQLFEGLAPFFDLKPLDAARKAAKKHVSHQPYRGASFRRARALLGALVGRD